MLATSAASAMGLPSLRGGGKQLAVGARSLGDDAGPWRIAGTPSLDHRPGGDDEPSGGAVGERGREILNATTLGADAR